MRRKKYSDDEIRAALKKYFGWDDFKSDRQLHYIKEILAGHDVMAVMPTGAGKSVCYQLPAMLMADAGITLVVTPLVALMQDQVDGLKSRTNDAGAAKTPIPAAFVRSLKADGGTGRGGARKKAYMDAYNKRCRLLYVTPERLLSGPFLYLCRHIDIAMVAVDEAHCVSVWGYDFRPDYLDIDRFIHVLGKRPVVAAFTATATEFVRKDAMRTLGLKPRGAAGGEGDFFRGELAFRIEHASGAEKDVKVAETVRKHMERGGKGIIFCTTYEQMDHAAGVLEGSFPGRVATYRSKMPEGRKADGLRGFRSGKKPIMVATTAFGMGVNIPDVRYVVNYNIPADIETYYQEAGRAGRDGKLADCVLYLSDGDVELCKGIAEGRPDRSDLDEDTKDIRKGLAEERLARMAAFAREHEGEESGKIYRGIRDYFLEWEPAGLGPEKAEEEYEKLRKRRGRVPALSANRTSVAGDIRKGRTRAGYDGETPLYLSRKKRPGQEIRYRLDVGGGGLAYFDMMVADAVYTLEKYRRPIHAAAICRLLGGDPCMGVKAAKRKRVEDSLAKMMAARITIEYPEFLDCYGIWEPRGILEGRFLPLARVQGSRKAKYVCEALPPLYLYAEMLDQFYTFDMDLLRTSGRSGPAPSGFATTVLTHYLLGRIDSMGNQARFLAKRSRLSQNILYSHDGRQLAEELGIPMPEDPSARNRRIREIYGRNYAADADGRAVPEDGDKGRIEAILDHFVERGRIASYERLYDGKEGVRQADGTWRYGAIRGVRILFE